MFDLSQAVKEMIDSTELYKSGDCKALYQRFNTEGYLLLRGMVPKDQIQQAHDRIFNHLKETAGELVGLLI